MLTMSHVLAICMYPGAPLAQAQDAASEDHLIESCRAFNVGDCQKMRDNKAVVRGHFIDFILNAYLGHPRLLLREFSKSSRAATARADRFNVASLIRVLSWPLVSVRL
ncbi:hypothetical protein X768_33670 [Mesorhizobium sp. LSJC265A00]|nr:hypothetical protein X768_33670 [Mesorhizobium sp. LSJC265A00]